MTISQKGLNVNFIISAIFLLMIAGGLIFYHYQRQPFSENSLKESEAIDFVKAKYTELEVYPNDKLPPTSIKSEKDSDGWYLAFIQEGSGVPIISAKCFFVQNSKEIKEVGNYQNTSSKLVSQISPKTCK